MNSPRNNPGGLTNEERAALKDRAQELKSGAPPRHPREGDVVCFFQGARKFRTRYATLGFSDKTHLDDGVMWPTAFAITELTDAVEVRITNLVKKALG